MPRSARIVCFSRNLRSVSLLAMTGMFATSAQALGPGFLTCTPCELVALGRIELNVDWTFAPGSCNIEKALICAGSTATTINFNSKVPFDYSPCLIDGCDFASAYFDYPHLEFGSNGGECSFGTISSGLPGPQNWSASTRRAWSIASASLFQGSTRTNGTNGYEFYEFFTGCNHSPSGDPEDSAWYCVKSGEMSSRDLSIASAYSIAVWDLNCEPEGEGATLLVSASVKLNGFRRVSMHCGCGSDPEQAHILEEETAGEGGAYVHIKAISTLADESVHESNSRGVIGRRLSDLSWNRVGIFESTIPPNQNDDALAIDIEDFEFSVSIPVGAVNVEFDVFTEIRGNESVGVGEDGSICWDDLRIIASKFGATLSDSNYMFAADKNFDGLISIDDLNLAGNELSAYGCLADFDCDGEVTITDYYDFLSAFSTEDIIADLDGDGEVTIMDYFTWLGVFFDGLENGC